MNSLRKCMATLLLISLCASLLACDSSSDKQTNNQSEKTDKIQIGITFDSFVIERWEREKDVFVSIAQELGAEVNVQNANGDIETQNEQINYFIDKGMDVIVVVSVDSDGIRDSIEKASDKGIKIISYDRLITDAPIDLYVSFDNEAVGRLMGNALVNNGIGKDSKVIMLGGPLTDNNVSLVEKGFKKVMEDKGVEILDSIHADGWKAEIAGTYIYEHLDTVMKCDAIMCGNDNMASKVIHALSEKRRAGKILVVGQDADLEACQYIVEGTQLMTVYKPVEKLAKLAAEYAVMMGRGMNINDSNAVMITNGRYPVPYIKLNPISVTESNMNEVVIKDGFHLKEDVYLNVPSKMPK